MDTINQVSAFKQTSLDAQYQEVKALLDGKSVTSAQTPDIGNREGLAESGVRTMRDRLLELVDSPRIGDDVPMEIVESSMSDTSSSAGITKARSIAAEIIKENGTIDRDKLTTAIEQLEADLVNPKQSKRMAAMLTKLKDSDELKTGLTNVCKDYNPHNSAKNAIRQTLGFGITAFVDKTDARRAALTAFMCDLRQGSAGSCFGTSTAILVKNHKPEQFMTDMKSLMEKGSLTRGGIETPINMSVSSKSLETKLTINADAQVTKMDEKALDEAVGLLDNPSFKSAMKASGIAAESQLQKVKDAITALNTDAADTIDITAEKILKQVLRTKFDISAEQLAQVKSDLAEGNDIDGALLQKAKGYAKAWVAANSLASAETDNRLLRAWEYTISSMAEHGTADELANNSFYQMMFGSLDSTPKLSLDAKATALKDSYDIELDDSLSEQGVSDALVSQIQAKVKQHVHVLYNADYQAGDGLSEDGSSDRGGFQMQFSPSGERLNDLVSIDNKQQYKEMMQSLIDKAVSELKQDESYADDDTAKSFITQLGAGLKAYAGDDDFVVYSQAKLKSTAPDSKEDNYEPWGIKSGANTRVTMQHYFELDDKPTRVTLGDTDQGPTLDSLNFIVTTLRSMNDDSALENKLAANENFSVPIQTGHHAFLLKLNPELMAGVTSDDGVSDWLTDTFGDGYDLGVDNIDDFGTGTRSDMLGYARTVLANLPDITDDFKANIKAKVEHAISLEDDVDDDLNFHDVVIDNIKSAMDKYFKQYSIDRSANSKLSVNQLSNSDHLSSDLLDEALWKSRDSLGNMLPDAVTVVVADTNWGTGDNHKQFAYTLSPQNSTVKFVQIDEHGAMTTKDADKWFSESTSILTDMSQYS
ncbi:hypothetical protein [Thalassomonas actiniarum]|uniref:Uncharacterized protein n=1 Tax=Thalassomonas actiniarum TaxID=485447 RepID=A0AAE9YWZ1_9GAMM|nr:hypothetical protein [Thalassomonas actiniarum]WDE02418.1 hypothetical protein SG35_028820 [Thalassomonas actiniarum]